MNIDNNDFFRKATMIICGNLNIEEALCSCILSFNNIIPVDNVVLQRYEPDYESMRIIASATSEKGRKLDLLVPLSDTAKSSFGLHMKFIINDVLLVNEPAKDIISSEMIKKLDLKAAALMVLILRTEKQMLGHLVLISQKEKFTKEHAELLSSLKEPFVVAMSNTLQHREVNMLKDLLSDDNRYLRGELRRKSGDEIIGANFGLRNIMEMVSQVASLNSPVLLLGETGVGKDVIANAIHYSSLRSKGPFVSVNCGAIPDTLIDSELFGHEKGSFTGALSQKRGRFERADKGTIFLDEIGELPLQAQVRLLKVLQNREIERVGGSRSIPLDIRIIAATNRDLEMMVRSGDFREDLWFRLNVFPIKIPPLRKRKHDIAALLQHFITLKARELNLPKIPDVLPGTVDFLMSYYWPGNVREMSNIVERAMILNPAGPLKFTQLIHNAESESDPSYKHPYASKNLDQLIAGHIKNVVEETNGKIFGPGGAAEILGVNPSSLRNKMDKYGIKYGRSFKKSDL